MKRVVSVSLGSSTRNKKSQFDLLGVTFELERIGTDGDMAKFQAMFEELDGKVDAMGIGGADLYLVSGDRRFEFKDIARCIRNVTKTPVVDGSGLKHTLERETILALQRDGIVDWRQERVLLMSAVDRYGMAQALDESGADVIYGDLLFGIGVPIPIRKYSQVAALGKMILPIITRLPLKWFYPTGAQQEARKPRFGKVFADRTLICGDSLYILRYAPENLRGKTILTQSVRKQNVEWFKQCGVQRIITTTPVIGGETFATNVMEAALVAFLKKRPEEIPSEEMIDTLKKIGWHPNVIDLSS